MAVFLPAFAYVGACLTGGVLLASTQRDPAGCAAGLAAMAMHQSWAAGFIYRIFARISFQSVPRASIHRVLPLAFFLIGGIGSERFDVAGCSLWILVIRELTRKGII